jgi:hypothetical protein
MLRKRVHESLGVSVSGQAGLYVYFLLLTHRWLEPDAISAWLIPSEFLDTKYGAALRQYLGDVVELLQVHQYSHDEVQFEDAMVSSAVVVFRNRLPVPDHQVLFSKGETLSRPKKTAFVTVRQLRQSSKWSYPHHATPSAASDKVLGDLFVVKRGIATGANDYFVLERKRANELRLSRDVLLPVLPKARYLHEDIIESDHDGFPVTDKQLCLVSCGLPWLALKSRFPSLAEYLESVPPEIRKRTLVSSRKLWYQQEVRPPAPFVATYMGRQSATSPIRFFLNRSSATALNNYLMIYPKPFLLELGWGDQLQLEVFRVLRSVDNDDLLRCGRVYGGGLHKIEPKELLKVPLQNVPKWIDDELKQYQLLV